MARPGALVNFSANLRTLLRGPSADSEVFLSNELPKRVLILLSLCGIALRAPAPVDAQAICHMPDAEGRAPNGWQAFLRPDAQKAFVLITDDSAQCSYEDEDVAITLGVRDSDPFEDALMFHSALIAKSPEQFGVPPDVRYQLYGFVGMRASEPENAPYFPHEGLMNETCDTAPSPGLSYQALSVITDSLRYPVCEGRGFDAVFRVLAQSVVESIKAECTFEIPQAPAEQTIDRRTISLRYANSRDGETLQLDQVGDSSECTEHSFYITDDKLELCPQSCELVQNDSAAELEVLYGCIYMVQ